MRILRFIPLLGAVVLFSATTLAFTVSGARAQDQDGSIFSGQQDDSSVSPDKKKPPLNISGDWSGTIEDNLAGEGILDAEFTETSNGTLGGTWTFMFDEGTDFGTIKGKATSDKVSITFVFAPKAPFVHCRFAVSDKHASDTDIRGNYKFTACGPLTKHEHGSLDMSPD
jgi:hypothetical protein